MNKKLEKVLDVLSKLDDATHAMEVAIAKGRCRDSGTIREVHSKVDALDESIKNLSKKKKGGKNG